MNNPDVLFDLLKNPTSYWVGAKQTSYASGGGQKRGDDDIVLFARPQCMAHVEEPETIPYKELEQMSRTRIEANIFLSSPDYPPFQWGLSLDSFYRVSPLDKLNVNDFIERAKALGSHSLYDYQKLAATLNPKDRKEQ